MTQNVGLGPTGQRDAACELGHELPSLDHKLSNEWNGPDSDRTPGLMVCVSELWFGCRSRWVGLFQHLRESVSVSQKHFRKCVQIFCIFLRIFVRPVHGVIAFKANVLSPFFHCRRNNCVRKLFNPIFQIDSSRGGGVDFARSQFDRTPKHSASGVCTVFSAEVIESRKKGASDIIGNISWRFWRLRFWVNARNRPWAPNYPIGPILHLSHILYDGDNRLPASSTLQKNQRGRCVWPYLNVATISKSNFFSSAVWAFQRELRHV